MTAVWGLLSRMSKIALTELTPFMASYSPADANERIENRIKNTEVDINSVFLRVVFISPHLLLGYFVFWNIRLPFPKNVFTLLPVFGYERFASGAKAWPMRSLCASVVSL